ncbi:MAG: SdrD B-like domain-containing protein [Saprospiraceae bacterium]
MNSTPSNPFYPGHNWLANEQKKICNPVRDISRLIRPGRFLILFGLFLCFCLLGTRVEAQTVFAPGEIMFTGYDSDDPDAFSIVLLTDVVSGTIIFITDRGWSNTTGFRVDNTNEGTISYTFNAAFSCGNEIFFTKNTAPNPDIWQARDINGSLIGTVATQAGGDANGMVLGTTGDQLFIYQTPTPIASNQSSFVTCIHMDGAFTNATTDDNSAKPTALANNQVVRFNTEVDDAKYDCSPNTGSGTFLQSVITNDNGSGVLLGDAVNNWIESDDYLALYPPCFFCCGTSPTIVSLDAPGQVSPNQIFNITINGTLPSGFVWQLYTAGCGIGSPVQTTTNNFFTVTAPSSPTGVTYYIRSSASSSCCSTISVCVDNTPLSLCTDCNAGLDVCGPCFLADPSPNPDLDSGCFEIKLIFILDESGSMASNANQVSMGVLAFLNSLNGQNIQVALIEFSDLARLVNDYTPINNTYINNIQNYFNPAVGFNGFTYMPNGGTNWHDAMKKADALLPSDMILFFTDGDPTAWTQANGTSSTCGGAGSRPPEIVNPVKIANKLKGEGTHMFMLGVGNSVNVLNLQRMSGFTAYQNGVNTIGTSDYSIGQFASLAADLAAFVSQLCNTPLTLDKQIYGAVCAGVQQFRFILHNPGTQSAATVVTVKDTFPSGYNNIVYNGPPAVKLCIGMACWPQGYNAPDNAFRWITNSIPPGGSDTLILSVNVLPQPANYTNTAWAQGSNTALISATVTSPLFVDDLPPTISCSPNVTIACSASTLPGNTGTPTSNDPDGSTPTLSYVDMFVTGSCPQEYVINRTWKATDGCFNTAVCLQTITTHDIVAPVMLCPSNLTISCTASTLPANTGTATATDNCSTITYTSTDVIVPGICAQERTITRTWKATDACGNFNTCNQIITVDDSAPPSMTCPVNLTIDCAANTLPAATGSASAIDNCSTFAVTSTDIITTGPCPQEKVITRTWKATDACGNFGTCNQIITIHDTTPPAMSCPGNITIECTASTLPANTGTSTATDNCSTFGITFSDVILSGGCPAEKIINRTWKATDACSNSSTCIQIITVDDSHPPVITCPVNITVECGASTLPGNTGTATAIDNCSTINITSTDVVVPGDCPQEHTIIRNWKATDACGNMSSCNQTITVDDSTSPLITCPASVTIECNTSTLPAVTGAPSATDNCSTFTFISTDIISSGSCPQASLITRTWRVTDACGNFSTCIQTIAIHDSTPPVITCPADVTVQCISSTLPAETGSATSTDNCDAAPVVTYNDITMSGPGLHGYSIARTWKATDGCSNSSTCAQYIQVDNPVDPSITGLAADTICSGGIEVFQAQDQGLGTVTYQWNFGSGALPGTATGIGPHNVTYTYNPTNGSVGAWVLLTVTFPGCASVTDTVSHIHVNSIPNTDFIIPSPNLCYFRYFSFKPTASQVPGYYYHWDFDSGASLPPQTGYGPYNVKYTSLGTKAVKLIVISNAPGATCGDTNTLSFPIAACLGSVTGLVKDTIGPGIGSVNVKLYPDNNLDGLPDPNVPFAKSVNTVGSGIFSMASITPGHYVLLELQPPGYVSINDYDLSNDLDSFPNVNKFDNLIPVTVEASENDANNIFVEKKVNGVISGYVFTDLNNDLIVENGEGILGVTITLYIDVNHNGIPVAGNIIATAQTSIIGFYEFGEIPVGDYILQESQPVGYMSSMDIDISDDNDVVANTNMTDDIIPVTLILGESDQDNFFTEIQTCGNMVTNTNDNGPGSLRYVLDCAENDSTIIFSPTLANQTIHLNSSRIEITKNIHILSGDSPRVKIQSDISGAFLIDAGFTAEIKNIDIISGLSGFPGAAFENNGQLILWDMTIGRNPFLLPNNYLSVF